VAPDGLQPTNLSSMAPDPSPSAYRLVVGGIDQRAQLPPIRQIWCCSVLPWSIDLRAVEKTDRQ
jgi:hypothetical protein